MSETLPADTEKPVATFERDTNTGLVKGLVYPRRADGRIEWYRMIPKEHIVFNSSASATLAAAILKAHGKPASELVYAEILASGQTVDPRHVLVLLQGFIELADLRGYSGATSTLIPVNREMVSAVAHITWLPNEEEPTGKVSTGEADATHENTGGFGYLSAIAGNRAFVRAVRRGLRIPLMGFDEIAKKDSALPEGATTGSMTSGGGSTVTAGMDLTATGSLTRAAQEGGFPFDEVKKAAQSRWNEDSATIAKTPGSKRRIENDPAVWADWKDIPPRDCLTLIQLIKASKAARAANTAAKKRAA